MPRADQPTRICLPSPLAIYRPTDRSSSRPPNLCSPVTWFRLAPNFQFDPKGRAGQGDEVQQGGQAREGGRRRRRGEGRAGGTHAAPPLRLLLLPRRHLQHRPHLHLLLHHHQYYPHCFHDETGGLRDRPRRGRVFRVPC